MKIVGVTACPTGIAHTYMAQEALEKAARKLGYDIKIETQGAIGIENKLSQSDIDEADVIIFAVAIMIEEEERFEGKSIVKVKVNEAITKAELIIENAVKSIE